MLHLCMRCSATCNMNGTTHHTPTRSASCRMQPTVPTALGTVDRHHKSNNITLVADIRRSVLYQSAC